MAGADPAVDDGGGVLQFAVDALQRRRGRGADGGGLGGQGGAGQAWLEAELPRRIDAPTGARIAVAAPRGEGKSTIADLQFALWCLLTKRKRYGLLLSETAEQAQILLAPLRAEVEANPRLRGDWPKGCRPGDGWREGLAVLASSAAFEALGSGQKVRGRRRGPHRPDLIVGDDLESDEAVKSPKRRKKLAAWWREAVLHAGPPDGSLDAVLVGTVLAHGSLLDSCLDDPLWDGRRWSSLVRWPKRMDLWDRFTEIARERGEEAARAFHRKRRREMDAGAEVTWPDAQPLLELMLMRATAPAAFAKEKLNRPLPDEDAIFAGLLRSWRDLPRAAPMFGVVDPSMGRAGGDGDPSAILAGAVDRRDGEPRLLVVEADIRRRPPDRLIRDVIETQRRLQCVMWGWESNGFQDFGRQALLAAAIRAGVPVPVRPIVNSSDKALRIESLQPFAAAGRILLGPGQETLREQLQQFPAAEHDDGPDALEMLWRLAMGSARLSPADGFRSSPMQPPHGAERIPWELYDA